MTPDDGRQFNVRMRMRDGRIERAGFKSRRLAEQFIHLIPLNQAALEERPEQIRYEPYDWPDIAAAIIEPTMIHLN